MKADSFVSTLTALTTRLADLLAAENELLKTRRPAELAATHEEKSRLAGAYEQRMTEMRNDPRILHDADPAEMKALKEAIDRFRALLLEHGRRIAAAKSVTERIFKIVTEDVLQRGQRVEGYDRSANLRPVFGKGPKTVSFALNQVI